MTGDPSAPEHTPEAEQPDSGRWQNFQRWMRELVVRLRVPPREIFADGRIYGGLRISTVVLVVAFLGVLWLYQTQRPVPTGGPWNPEQTSEYQDDDRAPADTREAPSRPPQPTTTPSSEPTEPTSTPPSRTEAPTTPESATPTTAEPRQSAPPARGPEPGALEPSDVAPTSAPAAP